MDSAHSQKGNIALIAIIGVIVLLIVGGVGFYFYSTQSKNSVATDTSSDLQKPETPLAVPKNNATKNSTPSAKTSSTSPTSQSQNPFDNPNYQNPFDQTQNPFNNL